MAQYINVIFADMINATLILVVVKFQSNKLKITAVMTATRTMGQKGLG